MLSLPLTTLNISQITGHMTSLSSSVESVFFFWEGETQVKEKCKTDETY